MASKDPIVAAAQKAFAKRLKDSNDVSANTRNAQSIAKAWRAAVFDLDAGRYEIEAIVAPELDQKIDVLDKTTDTAYEFKVSGKNAAAEFYKDVVKIILWNRKHRKRIKRLVFITEADWGRKHLDMPMPREYVKYLQDQELCVDIEYVFHE